MKGCKHLDYEEKYIDCVIVDLSDKGMDGVKHWKRLNPPYEGAPVNVQFCKKRGRINGIFDCYNEGEMPCREVEE